MSTLHVRVRVAGEDYALRVEDVLEVAEFGEVAPVAGASGAVLGVHNMHGQVLPVIDLARIFGLARVAAPERIVVVEHSGRSAGLAVDSVAGVEQLPETSEEVESPHLAGAVLAEGVLVGLVDLGSVLEGAQGTPAL